MRFMSDACVSVKRWTPLLRRLKMRPPEPLFKTPPGGTPRERLAAKIEEYSRWVIHLRQTKAAHLTKPDAEQEAAELLSSSECSVVFMKAMLDRLEREGRELEQMPDVNTYEDFPLPALDDEEPMPWEGE